MATTSFPALGIQPPQQPDILSQYGKVAALKSMLQNQQFQQQQMAFQQQMQPLQLQQEQMQVQQQQLQMKSQQAIAQSYIDAGGDLDKTFDVAKRTPGVLPSDLLTLQQHMLDVKTKYATMTKDQLANTAAQNENLRGVFDPVVGADPAQQPQLWAQAKQKVLSDPNAATTYGVTDPSQIPDYKDPMGAKLFDAALATGKQQVEDRLKTQQAAEAAAKAEEARAGVPKAQAEAAIAQASLKSYQTWQAQPSNQNKTYADYQNELAGAKAKAEAGGRLGAEESLARFQFNLQQGMLPDELKGVAPHLVPAAATAYEKASTDYLNAKHASDDMQAMLDLAQKSGNKVAYRYSPVTGVMEVNSAFGNKRVNLHELGAYGGAGNTWDKVVGYVGGHVTGASIPDDVLNDMRQVSESVQKNAQDIYNDRVATTNYVYRSKFQPQQGTPRVSSQAQSMIDKYTQPQR